MCVYVCVCVCVCVCVPVCVVCDRLDLEQRQLQQLLEVIQGEGLLTVVKVMCDWMTCQAPIITACAQVCRLSVIHLLV